jgi:hypothetical protein
MSGNAVNVPVVMAGAGNVARVAHVPGNIGLDGEDKGEEERNGGELHFKSFCDALLIKV